MAIFEIPRFDGRKGQTHGLGRHSSDIWNLIPACLMWTIWKECNYRTFEDVSKTDNQMLEGFIQTLFDWSKTWGFSSCTSISEFTSSLYLLSHDVYLWCVSVHALCTLHYSAIKLLILLIKKKKKVKPMDFYQLVKWVWAILWTRNFHRECKSQVCKVEANRWSQSFLRGPQI